VWAASGMQNHAPAAFAMGVDEVGHRRTEACTLQRLDNKAALPCSIASAIPVLHGTAPAYAEMRADGCYTVWTCSYDAQKLPPRGVVAAIGDLDSFAWQRAGNVNRVTAIVGNTVAEVAETIDQQMFRHVGP
jgi:hypothetical protein